MTGPSLPAVPGPLEPIDADPDRRRRRAIRVFEGHARVYVLVNLFLVGIWAATGAGAFWPIFPMLGWGLGLGLQGAATFTSRSR